MRRRLLGAAIAGCAVALALRWGLRRTRGGRDLFEADALDFLDAVVRPFDPHGQPGRRIS